MSFRLSIKSSFSIAQLALKYTWDCTQIPHENQLYRINYYYCRHTHNSRIYLTIPFCMEKYHIYEFQYEHTHTFYPQNGDDDKGVLSILSLPWHCGAKRTMAWNDGKLFWNGNFGNFAVKPYSIMMMMMMMVRSPPSHSVNRIKFDLIRNLYSKLIYIIIVLHVNCVCVRICWAFAPSSVRNEWAYQIPWITFIKSQSNGNDYEQPTSKDNNRKANERMHK